MLKILKYTMNC